jgi:hypothetical protein
MDCIMSKKATWDQQLGIWRGAYNCYLTLVAARMCQLGTID